MNFIEQLHLRSNDQIICAPLLKSALEKSKVVKIIPEWHINDLRSFYDGLIDGAGEVITIGEDFKQGGIQTGERWLEIRYDHDIPDLAAYRHSKNAQPLHTDESYIANPADIMVFYCVNKSHQGGATTFVDGPVLIEYLKANHPDLFKRLTTTDVSYKKGGEQRTEKIIDLSNPEIPKFNYNYYCISPDESEENRQLNQDFFNVLQAEVAHSYMAKKVSLAPGEGVAWWDEFVLHGRESFSAEKTNDRSIWKAGLKWVK